VTPVPPRHPDPAARRPRRAGGSDRTARLRRGGIAGREAT